MFWLLYVLNYFAGVVFMMRIATLRLRDRYERKLAATQVGIYMPKWSNYVWVIIPMVAFWPITVLVFGSWKLAFPRGVKTQFTKERELQAALRKAQREAEFQQRLVMDLEERVRAWTPRHPKLGLDEEQS